MFAVGLPALGAVVWLFPYANHIVFNVLVVIVAVFSALETARFFERGFSYPGHRISAGFLGCILPITSIVIGLNALPETAFLGVFLVATSVIFVSQVFRRDETRFPEILPTVTAHVFLLVYPGLFLSYMTRLSTLPYPAVLITTFILAVYLNDTGAYIAGMTLGRWSVRILPISPKKTLIGFVGGFIVSPAVILVAARIVPEAFPGAWWRAVLLGVLVSFTTIFGDLAESALKRSVTVKDSGNAIPGRGGVLDSIDSPLFVAPVFFLLYGILFIL